MTPTPSTEVALPADDLRKLADRINTEHSAIVRDAKSAVTRAIAAGVALIAAKAAIPRGLFGRWLGANTCVAERTAQLYMQMYRAKPQIEGLLRDQSATIAGLTLTGAVRMIRDGRQEIEADESNGPDSASPSPPPDPVAVALTDELHAAKLAGALLMALGHMPKDIAQRAAARVVERLQEEKLID
jgi:hypothetical protein